MPVKVASTPRSSTVNVAPAPWRYWGDRAIWDTQVNAHTNMMDGDGRVWWTATHRPQWEQPAFCRQGSDHPSAKAFPLERASGAATNKTAFVQNARGVTMFDPKTKKWAFVDTCFGTHHLNFGYDADNTLYLANNGGPELGWVNTRVFLETGDSAKSQGWTAFVVDTNGNGKRDATSSPAPRSIPPGTSVSTSVSTVSRSTRTTEPSGARVPQAGVGSCEWIWVRIPRSRL